MLTGNAPCSCLTQFKVKTAGCVRKRQGGWVGKRGGGEGGGFFGVIPGAA